MFGCRKRIECRSASRYSRASAGQQQRAVGPRYAPAQATNWCQARRPPLAPCGDLGRRQQRPPEVVAAEVAEAVVVGALRDVRAAA